MKWTGLTALMLLALFAATDLAQAAEGRKFWQVQNRFRVEYDDNIRQTADADTSAKLIDDLFLNASVNQEKTFFGLKYNPSLVYWFDRPEDDTDLNHELIADLSQKFTPQLTLLLKDRFLLQELPELMDGGTPVRSDGSYAYNDLVGALNYRFTAATDLDLSGRWNIMRYDDDNRALVQDYDSYVLGASVNHQVVPETGVSGDLRFETITYDQNDARDADTVYLGAGVSQTFSPTLLGSLRGGYQMKTFDDDTIEDADSPYADLALTWLPTAVTRVSTGIGYSLDASYVGAYANQERTKFFAALAHDFTAKVAWYLSGNYTSSKYDAAESVIEESTDADEEFLLLSTRVAYQLNTSNWLELSWSFTDVSSDIRTEYDRNRVSLGWKVKI